MNIKEFIFCLEKNNSKKKNNSTAHCIQNYNINKLTNYFINKSTVVFHPI